MRLFQKVGAVLPGRRNASPAGPEAPAPGPVEPIADDGAVAANSEPIVAPTAVPVAASSATPPADPAPPDPAASETDFPDLMALLPPELRQTSASSRATPVASSASARPRTPEPSLAPSDKALAEILASTMIPGLGAAAEEEEAPTTEPAFAPPPRDSWPIEQLDPLAALGSLADPAVPLARDAVSDRPESDLRSVFAAPREEQIVPPFANPAIGVAERPASGDKPLLPELGRSLSPAQPGESVRPVAADARVPDRAVSRTEAKMPTDAPEFSMTASAPESLVPGSPDRPSPAADLASAMTATPFAAETLAELAIPDPRPASSAPDPSASPPPMQRPPQPAATRIVPAASRPFDPVEELAEDWDDELLYDLGPPSSSGRSSLSAFLAEGTRALDSPKVAPPFPVKAALAPPERAVPGNADTILAAFLSDGAHALDRPKGASPPPVQATRIVPEPEPLEPTSVRPSPVAAPSNLSAFLADGLRHLGDRPSMPTRVTDAEPLDRLGQDLLPDLAPAERPSKAAPGSSGLSAFLGDGLRHLDAPDHGAPVDPAPTRPLEPSPAAARADAVRQPATSNPAPATPPARPSLAGAQEIAGLIGACLVDSDSGLVLASEGRGLDDNGAATLSIQVVQAERKVIERLGLDDRIEDILITMGRQLHVIRPLVRMPSVFLYLALDRKVANLGMARMQLIRIEGGLTL